MSGYNFLAKLFYIIEVRSWRWQDVQPKRSAHFVFTHGHQMAQEDHKGYKLGYEGIVQLHIQS